LLQCRIAQRVVLFFSCRGRVAKIIGNLNLKVSHLLFTTLLFSSSALASESEKSTSFGVGLGAMYSGIGGNFAFVSNTDMKYVSLGCTSYSSDGESSCGAGLGWIKTDLFNADSNKHGLGIYVGKVDEDRRARVVNGRLKVDEEDVYGLGLSYTYFASGINSPGFNFGISVHKTNSDYQSGVSAFWQVGYQF